MYGEMYVCVCVCMLTDMFESSANDDRIILKVNQGPQTKYIDKQKY